MFASCKAISDFLDDGEVVAKVGEARLLMEDLQKVIPNGISPEDSTLLARQYITTWALDFVCEVRNGTLMVDDNTVQCLFQTFLDYPVRISIDYDENVIIIEKQ